MDKVHCGELIKAKLLKLEGINAVYYKFNPQLHQEVGGFPASSISFYIDGGNDQDIAKIIAYNKGLGIQLNGTFCIQIEVGGLSYSVSWTKLHIQNVTIEKKEEEKLKLKVREEELIKELVDIRNKLGDM